MSRTKGTQNGLPLYTSAFAMAMSLSTWWTAMPFIIRRLGGTEEHVGLAPALHMTGYLVFLLLAYHLRPSGYKRALCCSLGIMSGAMLVICLAIGRSLPAGPESQVGRIRIIMAAGAVFGAALAFFWPNLMGWAAHGFAGRALNRRLGFYNVSWSSAVVMGPALGASLVESSLLIPVLIPMVLLLLCLGLLLPLKDQSPDSHDAVIQADSSVSHAPGLRYCARIALFSAWFGGAIMRSQFALLITDLGFAKSQFGMIVSLCAASNLIVLWMAGRWAAWHGRVLPIILTQVLAALAMLLFIRGLSVPVFALAAILHGSTQGFAYSAHLYYSAAGPNSRSKSMIIHELTIAIATVIGSATGGYVSSYGGAYWPYWVCLWLALASGVVQMGINKRMKYEV